MQNEIHRLLQKLIHPALPGIDLGLARMEEFLDALGNPHHRLPPVIHIAGTNGKGSTLAFLDAIYAANGYRVHRYTSPHLVRFNERIRLAGREIDDNELLPLLEQVSEVAARIPVTFFEATTALAFLAFASHTADLLLLETGLGGRLDATNVVRRPAMTIITPVGFDHQEFLGTDLASIAREKAGIIKPHCFCVLGSQQPEAQAVFEEVAAAKQATLLSHGRDWFYEIEGQAIRVRLGRDHWQLPMPGLAGPHQYHNAALASVAAWVHPLHPLRITELAQGIETAQWPGRLQRLTHGPLVEAWGTRGAVFLDGAHNVDGARALATWAETQPQPLTILCGMMARKSPEDFFAALAPKAAAVIAVPIAGEDCHPPLRLAQAAQAMGAPRAMAADSISAALERLNEAQPGTLLVTGSLFLAGEILKNHG